MVDPIDLTVARSKMSSSRKCPPRGGTEHREHWGALERLSRSRTREVVEYEPLSGVGLEEFADQMRAAAARLANARAALRGLLYL